ncbi:MAG: coenzyme F420-0:L-glutamate ligase [Patescibacteria group bacterium]|nr:coenzyme F420-0:L-glutamate ligase [Patescibacteria group bacterium]
MNIKSNPGKNLFIKVEGKKYARYPIKTHLITPEEKDLSETVLRYTKNITKLGDIIFIGEKSVAISQKRAYHKKDVKPSKLAYFLVRFVTKTPIGIGLGSPETMQLAIEEAGVIRILVATFIAGITKPFGIKGMFYIIAGSKARAIDGAASYVIAPYNEYVSKGPSEPNKTAEEISQKIGLPVAIVDACDFGVKVLGASKSINKKLVVQALKDNPLGQTDEQTPIGILREEKDVSDD